MMRTCYKEFSSLLFHSFTEKLTNISGTFLIVEFSVLPFLVWILIKWTTINDLDHYLKYLLSLAYPLRSGELAYVAIIFEILGQNVINPALRFTTVFF